MPFVFVAAPVILGAAVQAEQARATKQRFPKVKPGDFLRAALDIQALSEAGHTPRITTDPFTGDFVISTADQSENLLGILADRRINELLRPTSEEAQTASETREIVLSLLPGTVGATRRQIAPGIVRKGQPTPGRPLSGPCAGGLTRLSQIRCNVGGFA